MSETPHRRPGGGVRRELDFHLYRTSRHFQMAPHFRVKLCFSFFSPPETHRLPPPFPCICFGCFLSSSRLPYSPGCSTPAIASESCDHFERSLVNCFFPAAVSW